MFEKLIGQNQRQRRCRILQNIALNDLLPHYLRCSHRYPVYLFEKVYLIQSKEMPEDMSDLACVDALLCTHFCAIL